MSSSYSLSSLTEPERDLAVWYSVPDLPVFRPVAALAVSDELPLADDTPAELIEMPMAA